MVLTSGKIALLSFVVALVYDFLLRVPNMFFKQDPWQWHRTPRGTGFNIYNWFYTAWLALEWVTILSFGFFIIAGLILLLLVTKISF